MANLSRRGLLSMGVVAAGYHVLGEPLSAQTPAQPAPRPPRRPFIYTGSGPGRGTPPPHSLQGEALVNARLTEDSWRLEIVGDAGCRVQRPRRLEDQTAIDLRTLHDLGRRHGVKFLKAMQCRSGNFPQSHGLWEGVPLREVLNLAGNIDNVMRVYFNGFHNNDPRQLFQSSASYTQVFDNAPGELPVMVAYRHNGGPISLLRGGPVRLIVPWGYGFKNIKWLQRLRLTNDTRPIDTYGGEPDGYLKTQVPRIDGPSTFQAGTAGVYHGVAVVGMPGLRRVEYWLRSDAGNNGELPDNDPAWQQAEWQPAVIDPAPDDWTTHLPMGVSPNELWGFDSRTGRPKDWPLRYTVATWSLTLQGLRRGAYELRVRTVDQNGHAQPQPRPQQPAGRCTIPCRIVRVAE
jgi:DMSO/TMAO reductase YedYZ molybdopterin-dependent catalytic subunit